MSIFEALFLGIIQGLTEFLPVSSSGHLVLGQYLLGFRDLSKLVDFTLACHLGTLLAVFVFFRKQIWDILVHDHKKILWVILGTLPLFPLALFAEPIKSMFDKVQYLGWFFIVTAVLLYLATYWAKNLPETQLDKSRWRDSLIIGLFQALAILPGISRSGSTISGARLLGWPPKEAITYSFLLSIPAILGGCILEFGKLYFNPSLSGSNISFSAYAIGFLSAFIVGCGALALLVKIVQNNKLMIFSWYCLVLGIGTLVYFNFN